MCLCQKLFYTQAFRIVTKVPGVLLKSATKKLQEGFQGARERLSMGATSMPSTANNSFSESPSPNPHGAAHHTSFGKQVEEGLKSWSRVHFYSMSSTSNHSKSKDSNRSSPVGENKDEGPSSTHSEDGSFCSETSNTLAREDREGEVVAVRRVNKMPSGLSSTCSFASMSGDELGSKISEGDEMDETSIGEADDGDQLVTSIEKTAETPTHSIEPLKSTVSDMSVQNDSTAKDEEESAQQSRKKKKNRFKRQRNAAKGNKEESSKCVIQ